MDYPWKPLKCFNCKELGHSTVKCPKNTQTLTQPLKKKKEIKRDWVPKKTDNANDWRVVQRPSGMKQRADMIEMSVKLLGLQNLQQIDLKCFLMKTYL